MRPCWCCPSSSPATSSFASRLWMSFRIWDFLSSEIPRLYFLVAYLCFLQLRFWKSWNRIHPLTDISLHSRILARKDFSFSHINSSRNGGPIFQTNNKRNRTMIWRGKGRASWKQFGNKSNQHVETKNLSNLLITGSCCLVQVYQAPPICISTSHTV